jgi:adenylate kinase family enzyme
LAKTLQAEIVSPGQELRELASYNGVVGDEAQRIIRAAAPVPDEMLWTMLSRHQSNRVLLDAVPRNTRQVNLLTSFARENHYEIIAIHLLLPRRVALDRLTKRRSSGEDKRHCSCDRQLYQRLDDKLPGTVTARFDKYEQEVVPAANRLALQFECQEIDASRELSDVMMSIMSWLKSIGA